jgi:hypothetical protein
MSTEQKHPLAHLDREIIKNILVQGKNDYNLAEVARLKIRYRNFPGARDIQHDLEVVLQQWELTEEELFAETRRLHSQGKVYRQKLEEREDWS